MDYGKSLRYFTSIQPNSGYNNFAIVSRGFNIELLYLQQRVGVEIEPTTLTNAWIWGPCSNIPSAWPCSFFILPIKSLLGTFVRVCLQYRTTGFSIFVDQLNVLTTFIVTVSFHHTFTSCSVANKGRSAVNDRQSLVFDRPYLSCNDHCNRWVFQEIFFYYYFQKQSYADVL